MKVITLYKRAYHVDNILEYYNYYPQAGGGLMYNES